MDLETFIGKEDGLTDGNVVDGDDVNYAADTTTDVCVKFGFLVVQGFDLLDEVADDEGAGNFLEDVL